MFSQYNSKILNLLNSIKLIELIYVIFFRLLLLLINIDQETVLNWFGIEDPTKGSLSKSSTEIIMILMFKFEPSTDVSLDTFRINY
jgi:hypothetical protein